MTNSAARETEEAVLESIRRLLGDGPAAVRKSGRAAAPAEKLLLTPALRVPEEAPSEPAPRPAARAAAWSLEDQIAELEAAIGAVGDWEPDGSEDAAAETPAPGVFQHRDARTAAAESAPLRLGESARTERLAPPDLVDENDLVPTRGFDIDADDRLPDEDALRDLVAEIVRSELQSELGQRVTRNIRKLVRREIRRALAARDFD
jgi:hypothetical protein